MVSWVKPTPTPATSDEQKAMLGNVRRIPRDVDMFTGEVVTKPPKRGRGDHIQLKSIGIEKPVIPGMADHAGEGPSGKYCWDCKHFGEVAVLRPDGDETVEMNRTGCVLWAHRMGHAAPIPARNIGPEAACKQFTQSDHKTQRFVITQEGETVEVENFASNLHLWAIKRKATGNG